MADPRPTGSAVPPQIAGVGPPRSAWSFVSSGEPHSEHAARVKAQGGAVGLNTLREPVAVVVARHRRRRVRTRQDEVGQLDLLRRRQQGGGTRQRRACGQGEGRPVRHGLAVRLLGRNADRPALRHGPGQPGHRPRVRVHHRRGRRRYAAERRLRLRDRCLDRCGHHGRSRSSACRRPEWKQMAATPSSAACSCSPCSSTTTLARRRRRHDAHGRHRQRRGDHPCSWRCVNICKYFGNVTALETSRPSVSSGQGDAACSATTVPVSHVDDKILSGVHQPS